ncbi:MAG: hypothetical protein VKN33_05585 [Candidatus Sericytochromatia bacterium]|nr:hypothetical protein [Candidatus Sericytochromatia bacterium]
MSEPDDVIAKLFDQTRLVGRFRRRSAVDVIVTWDDVRAVEPLARAVVELRDDHVQRKALDRLGQLTEQTAVDVVCEVWADTRHPLLDALIREKGWLAAYQENVRILGLLARGEAESLMGVNRDGAAFLVAAASDRDPHLAEAAARVLTQLQRADAVDALVEMALEHDDLRALQAIRDGGYSVADPSVSAVLLILTQQLTAYEAHDPTGAHLADALQSAPLPRRHQLALKAREHRLAPWAYALRRLPPGEILPVEWDCLLTVLLSHGSYEDIWRWSVRASVPVALGYVRALVAADWSPALNAPDARLFRKLAGLQERCEGEPDASGERIIASNIFEGSPGHATLLAVSSNWHFMAVGGDHEAVRVFSLPDGEPVASLDGLPGWTRAVAFGGMGRLLAIATMNNRTRVHRIPDGEIVASLETPDVSVIAMRGDGRLLAASCGARIDLWDVERERIVHAIGNQGRTVKRIEMGPRGRALAAWGSDGVTRVWSLPDGALLTAFDGAEGGLAALAFNADETQLAISDRGGILRVYSLPSCELLCEVSTETKAIRSLAFRPDGDVIAVGGHDHFVRLVALPEGELLGQVDGYAGASVLQWNSLGQLLTGAVEGNRTARIWFPALPPLTALAVQHARADEIAWAQRRHQDPQLPRQDRTWLTAWGTLVMALRGALPRKEEPVQSETGTSF